MSLHERREVMAGEFGRAFHTSVARHVTWIFWTLNSDAPTEILGQGTTFILDGGNGPFLVTAAHVYRQYLNDFENHGALYCQIANARVSDLRFHLIESGDENQGPDIATFRLTNEAVGRIGKKPIRAPNGDWSPGPKIDYGAMIAGYPGHERLIIKPDEISFGLYSAQPVMTSVTNRQITCRLDHEFMVDSVGNGLPRPGYGLGGISGGPLLIPEFRDTTWIWRLAGILSEAPDEKPEQDVLFESVVAERAEYILPNGNLAKIL